MQYLCFYIQLISCRILSSSLSMFYRWQDFHHFKCRIVFHYIYYYVYVYSIIYIMEYTHTNTFSWVLIHYALTVPCGRNHGLKWSLLALSCTDLGEGVMGKVKLFLHSLMHMFSNTMLQWCSGTCPLDSWTPTKVLLSMADFQNQCSTGKLWLETSILLSCWPRRFYAGVFFSFFKVLLCSLKYVSFNVVYGALKS